MRIELRGIIKQKIALNFHSFMIILFFSLSVWFWISNQKTMIVSTGLAILITSTIVEVLLKGGNMSYKGLVMNMLILIGSFYFLLNGVGQTFLLTNSMGLSSYSPSVDYVVLAGVNTAPNLFAEVFSMPTTGAVIGFAILGGVLINVGDALDNGSIYASGALVATILPMIVLIAVLSGYIPPSDYFYQLGGSMANIMEFSALLGVLILILMVVFLFDDLISSATAGEEYD
jgi:hypothetical protein